MTQRSEKNSGRVGTMDGRDLTAGRENQQYRRSVHQQTWYRAGEIIVISRTSYCAGEILHSPQDLTTVFITSNFTFIQ